MISMTFFWILIIVALVFLAKWLISGSQGEKFSIKGISGSRVIDLLMERYAQGEISKAEFEDKKKDLME
jgi:putative membrane protein